MVGALWIEEEHGPRDHEPSGEPPLDEAALNAIGYVSSRYGRLSGRDLETLTRTETPWLDADAHREPGTSVLTRADDLRPFFREAARAGDDWPEACSVRMSG